MKVSTNSVFISYSARDRAFVERLAADLKAKGLYVWFDQWALKVGDSIVDKINAGIMSHDYLIVVLSKASVDSQWVKKELSTGLMRELEERRVVVLPVLIEDCDIPALLTDKVYADFRDDYSRGLNKLLDTFPGHLFASGISRTTLGASSGNVSVDHISRANIADLIRKPNIRE